MHRAIGSKIAAIWRHRSRLERGAVVVAFLLALAWIAVLFFRTDYQRSDHPAGDGHYHTLLAAGDGHRTYLSTRSFVLDGDIDLRNDVDRFRYGGGIRQSPSGDPVFPHGFGPVLLWSPFLALAHGASKIANAFGAHIPDHGYTMFHQRIVLFTSVLWAVFAAVAGYRVARRWLTGRWSSLAAALAILFGTPVFYYAAYMPSYAHAMNAGVSALFLGYWACTIGRADTRRFVILGAILGVAGMVRVVSLGLGIAVAVEVAVAGLRAAEGSAPVDRLRHAARWVARGGIALATALIAFVPQLVAWKVQMGTFVTSLNGPGYVTLSRPFVPEFLFSSLNGLFSTTPLALIAAAGLLVAPKRARLVAAGLLAALALQIYVNSCVYDWWGMGSFGARRMCGTTLILVVGLASALRAVLAVLAKIKIPRAVAAVPALAAVAWLVLWNVDLARAHQRGKHRYSLPHAMCCEHQRDWMATVAEPIYDEVGNPFALPASAWFAWRYDVPLGRWDRAVGWYTARPRFVDLMRDRHLDRTFYWNLPGVNFTPFLAGGWGPRQRYMERNFRWTVKPRARFLVPTFLDRPLWFRFSLRPNAGPHDGPTPVRVRVNDHTFIDTDLEAGWNEIEFVVPPSVLSRMNVFEVIAEPRAYRVGRSKADKLRPHPERRRVGVAMRMLMLEFAEDELRDPGEGGSPPG